MTTLNSSRRSMLGLFNSEITGLQTLKKEPRSLLISLSDRSFQIRFKHGGDCHRFYTALLNTALVSIELNRTVYGVLRYDLAGIIDFDWKLKVDQFLKLVSSRFTYAKTFPDFTKEFSKLIAEFGFIADAFYAFQPFFLPIFSYFAIKFLQTIRVKLQKMWNDNFSTIGAVDCLSVSDTMVLFLSLLSKWGVRDAGLLTYYKPVVLKFTQCLFLNSREMLMNIMDEITQTATIINGKISSSMFSNLEGHLFFVLDHHSKFPSLFFLREIIMYVSAVIAIFLIHILRLIDDSVQEPFFFIALLNANMIKIIRNSEKKILELTAKKMSISDVRNLIVDGFLIKRIGLIFNKSIKLLQKHFRHFVILPGFNKITSFFEFDFRKHLDKIIYEANHNLSLLNSETLFKEFFQYIFVVTFKQYARLYFQLIPKLKPKEFLASTGKLKSDLSYFSNFCIDDILENSYLIKKHLSAFSNTLQSTEISQIIVGFINLQISFPKIFNQKNVDIIVKTRMNQEEGLRNYVKNHIHNEDIHDLSNVDTTFNVKQNQIKKKVPFFWFYVIQFVVTISFFKRTSFFQAPNTQKVQTSSRNKRRYFEFKSTKFQVQNSLKI